MFSYTSLCKETEKQFQWQLPPLVPAEYTDYDDDTLYLNMENHHQFLQSDTLLYRMKEQTADGSIQNHSLLKMMSKIPESLIMPKGKGKKTQATSTYNIFMGDVSGSMSGQWPLVVLGWNTHIQPKLVGRTSIMTFGSQVTMKRTGTTDTCSKINQRDFDGDCTDLTGALQAIVEEVYKCKEKFINVFFITDGGHNQTECPPDHAIEKMRAADGKICEVYVLGVGTGFPVNYSVNIRSRLHNGRSNLPTIFWAKYSSEMEEQLQDIGRYLGDECYSDTIKLSISGNTLPFTSPRNSFYLDEFVFFDNPPEDLQEIYVEIGNTKCALKLAPQNPKVDLYLNDVFRQWNGILIQMHNKKEPIPPEILPFMERIYKTITMNDNDNLVPHSIRSRLESKNAKTHHFSFQKLMNQIKNILTHEQYSNDMELAENILSSTVSANKYAEKALRMKGHTTEDFEMDIKEFKTVVEKCKPNFNKIESTTDDCCRVTLTSTFSDLKDEDFNDLLELGKYDFLKTFTMSGIPILTPLKDAVHLNPWIFSIRRILKCPYTIVSQVVLETNPDPVADQHKGLRLQEDDEETCFNAIIPVFPLNFAAQMREIMNTKIYAMCCTFAILKNPHIIDYNVHMAALGIVWVRLLYEFPQQPRPEYVRYRIACIEATAKNYFGRPSFVKYLNILKCPNSMNQAIMTESTIESDGKSLKCESLVKPMFILYMGVKTKQITDKAVIKKIVKLILMEYVGRCISINSRKGEKKNLPLCSEFFTTGIDKQNNMGLYAEETKAMLVKNKDLTLLDVFSYEEECKKAAKSAVKEVIKTHYWDINESITITINHKRVKKLRSVSACGDVSWASLETFAKEVGLSSSSSGSVDVEENEDLFNNTNICRYVAHGFKYIDSRKRLATPLDSDDKYLDEIRKETFQKIFIDISDKLVKEMVDSWKKCYNTAHAGVVQPMTKAQIIEEANVNKMMVNHDNFDKIYKRYRPRVGLMGNACQSRKCPWFLKPMKTYNQHVATERRNTDFPHGLHKICQTYCNSDMTTILDKILPGDNGRSTTTHQRVANLDILNLKNVYMKMA